MPRGSNPKSMENLIPFAKRTETEQRKIRQKGGKKSGEIRAAIKPLRELLKEQCTEKDRLEINANLIRMAKRNIRAYELLMNALGEKPSDKVDVTGIAPVVIFGSDQLED